MGRKNFHDEPFDEGTLNKLDLFEKYAGEWVPVFVSQAEPRVSELHIYDFFAGPGRDVKGRAGSPLRLLAKLAQHTERAGWAKVRVHAHFFDKDSKKVETLGSIVEREGLAPSGCHVDIRALDFEAALADARPVLKRRDAAKLVLIDQTGIGAVSDDLFVEMIEWPRCDFLFFLASSALHRFPFLKEGIKSTGDHRNIHRAAADYYRGRIPAGHEYFVAPFSFMKGSNVYGLIFGSGHPLGMDKFLRVAWDMDPANGEANFDIGREGIRVDQSELFEKMAGKVGAFEAELATQIKAGSIRNEKEVLRLCFVHGVRGSHAEDALKRLKREKVIELDFRVPNVDKWPKPRPIRLLQPS